MSSEVLKFIAGFFSAAVIFYVRERMRRTERRILEEFNNAIIVALEADNERLHQENEQLRRVASTISHHRSQGLN